MVRATFLLLAGFWTLAVWAFFGGAISRIAVVQLAADERVGWGGRAAVRPAKVALLFRRPLLPLLGRPAGRGPAGDAGPAHAARNVGVVVVGVIWPLVSPGRPDHGLAPAGALFGWPLMWATISAEGTDSFDALSRSYAYLFQRPLHYSFYVSWPPSSAGSAGYWWRISPPA